MRTLCQSHQTLSTTSLHAESVVGNRLIKKSDQHFIGDNVEVHSCSDKEHAFKPYKIQKVNRTEVNYQESDNSSEGGIIDLSININRIKGSRTRKYLTLFVYINNFDILFEQTSLLKYRHFIKLIKISLRTIS